MELPVTEQLSLIQEYARKRGWKITSKYSDRSNDPMKDTAFQKLRKDSVARQFDCVIVYSMFQFGADTYQAVQLLRNAFIPAGLHFVVISDNFCSCDHTEEEIEEYLSEARKRLAACRCSIRFKGFPQLKIINTFGYYYDEESNSARHDPETSEVVREIFRLLKDGVKPRKIAEILNERNIETPIVYQRRICGWEPLKDPSPWTTDTLDTLTRKQKLAGRWSCIKNGKDVAADCPPIIEPELFDEVQQIIKSRRCHTLNNRPKEPNVFRQIITDKETGVTLIKYWNKNTKTYDIRFRYPKPADVKYDRQYLDHDEAIRQTKALLADEKKRAQAVIRKLEDPDVQEELLARKQALRESVPSLLKQVGEVETRRVKASEEHRSGSMSDDDYEKTISHCNDRFSELDLKLEKVICDIETIDFQYSKKNPWVRLFLAYDEERELTKKYLLKFVTGLQLYRFQTMELQVREQEGKSVFPQEWLEVDING